jgi:hypothetical protein
MFAPAIEVWIRSSATLAQPTKPCCGGHASAARGNVIADGHGAHARRPVRAEQRRAPRARQSAVVASTFPRTSRRPASSPKAATAELATSSRLSARPGGPPRLGQMSRAVNRGAPSATPPPPRVRRTGSPGASDSRAGIGSRRIARKPPAQPDVIAPAHRAGRAGARPEASTGPSSRVDTSTGWRRAAPWRATARRSRCPAQQRGPAAPA